MEEYTRKRLRPLVSTQAARRKEEDNTALETHNNNKCTRPYTLRQHASLSCACCKQHGGNVESSGTTQPSVGLTLQWRAKTVANSCVGCQTAASWASVPLIAPRPANTRMHEPMRVRSQTLRRRNGTWRGCRWAAERQGAWPKELLALHTHPSPPAQSFYKLIYARTHTLESITGVKFSL